LGISFVANLDVLDVIVGHARLDGGRVDGRQVPENGYVANYARIRPIALYARLGVGGYYPFLNQATGGDACEQDARYGSRTGDLNPEVANINTVAYTVDMDGLLRLCRRSMVTVLNPIHDSAGASGLGFDKCNELIRTITSLTRQCLYVQELGIGDRSFYVNANQDRRDRGPESPVFNHYAAGPNVEAGISVVVVNPGPIGSITQADYRNARYVSVNLGIPDGIYMPWVAKDDVALISGASANSGVQR